MHHVFAHTQEPKVFDRATDYAAYLALLQEVAHRCGWRCLAFCLMPNHIHLVLETPQPNLGAGMWRLQHRFALGYNKRYDGSGYVWDGRYGNRRIKDDAYLMTALWYLAYNPVRARLAAAPEAWRWSSCGPVLEHRSPAWLDEQRLLEYLGGPNPRAAYEELCRYVPPQ